MNSVAEAPEYQRLRKAARDLLYWIEIQRPGAMFHPSGKDVRETEAYRHVNPFFCPWRFLLRPSPGPWAGRARALQAPSFLYSAGSDNQRQSATRNRLGGYRWRAN